MSRIELTRVELQDRGQARPAGRVFVDPSEILELVETRSSTTVVLRSGRVTVREHVAEIDRLIAWARGRK